MAIRSIRHKWGPPDRHGDSACIQCGKERTKVGRLGGHWEYWIVTPRNYSRPELGWERQLLGVPAGPCLGGDYYRVWREDRERRLQEERERRATSST